jgi:oligopeptide transport system substrate-binding protein
MGLSRPRRWTLFAGTTAGAAALVLSGLAGLASTSDAQSGGTLRVLGTGSDVDYVDPALAYRPASWNFMYAVCARLYGYPDRPAPEGARIVPEIAKAFPSFSGDGRTATIELRRTYRFHTGARITAASFVSTINRLANPRMQSPAAFYLTDIVGARAVLERKARSISGVEAVGPYTLRIRTTRRSGDLAARLSMPFFCPLPARTRIDPAGVDDPAGSGPYYVASRVRGRQLVLERNRFYRGPRKPHVARIVFSVGTGREACRLAVEQNDADYCGGIPTLSAEVAREYVARFGINRPGGRFFFTAESNTEAFVFNHDRRAFKSPGQIPLKQAINWAIDRPALVRAGGALSGRRTDQILPPALTRPASIYPIAGVTPRSLGRARALLARARFRPAKLVLYTLNLLAFPVRAQIFQFNLRRLGIDVEVKYFTLDALSERTTRRGEPYDVVLSGWASDYPDGGGFFSVTLDGQAIRTNGNSNLAYFDRPRYNRAIARINGLQGEARRRAWAALDAEMMRDDPPWAPFQNAARADLVSEDLGCYVLQPVVGRLNLVAACKK